MESALSSLQQVNGLVALARTAQPPISGSRKAGLTSHAINAFFLQSQEILRCHAIFLIFGKQRPNDPSVLVGDCYTGLRGS